MLVISINHLEGDGIVLESVNCIVSVLCNAKPVLDRIATL